jgi:Protein of unknown function (DUF2470)
MAPANGAPSDAAMQARIITHMNADHADSLSLFLQFYNNLSPTLASNPQLDTFTLDHMTIKSSFGRSHIPLTPPLTSYAEARQRMVDMNAEALTGLGFSSTKIEEYVPPQKLWQLFIFGLCLVCFVSFSPVGSPDLGPNASHSRVNLLYMFWSFGGLVPELSYFAHDVAMYVFVLMLVVHGSEAGWMAYSRLRRHRVSVGTLVWWQWVLSCSIEGFGSFLRFDQLVNEKVEEEQKKKH